MTKRNFQPDALDLSQCCSWINNIKNNICPENIPHTGNGTRFRATQNPCWFPAYVLSDIPGHQEMYTKNENDLLD